MPLYFLALISLFFQELAFSQTAEIPFNGNGRNTIEYKQSGNNYTWQPVTGQTPKSAQPYRPDLSHGSVSNVEPKAKWTPQLPYDHKGGSSVKATINWPVDPKKVADAASKAAGAAAAGAATGNGYVAVGAVLCAFVCAPLADALIEWGVNQFNINNDASLSVNAPDPNADHRISDGYFYSSGYSSQKYIIPQLACNEIVSRVNSENPNHTSTGIGSPYPNPKCVVTSVQKINIGIYPAGHVSVNNWNLGYSLNSSCPAGSPIVNGVCNGYANIQQDLEDYLQSKYNGKGWDHYWAGVTAGLVASGVNVFTDGTGTTITGPAIVPISTSETKTPVNLQPGTTTPVTPGHTGPTDSGTQTTTKTTTANNTYRPGSSSSGPSMETKTQTTTTTNITNNISNTTSTTIINETTESDEAPKAEEKDFCEKHPDSLACAELDTPEGEVPRDTIEIDFEPEDLGLGSGVCPPDRPIDSLTVFSYQPTCDVLDTYAYPLTILLASFGALLIIFVGKAEA